MICAESFQKSGMDLMTEQVSECCLGDRADEDRSFSDLFGRLC